MKSIENLWLKDVFYDLKNHNIVNYQISLINICNYKCKYCYIGKQNNLFLINFDKTVNIIKNIDNRYTSLLIGGEPTLHPNIFKFLDYFENDDKCIEYYIISNGYKELDYFEKFLKYKKFYFIFSFHFSMIQHLDQLMNKVLYLKDRIKFIHIVIDKSVNENIEKVLSIFRNNGIKYTYIYLYNNGRVLDNYLYKLDQKIIDILRYYEYKYVKFGDLLLSDLDIYFNKLYKLKGVLCYNNIVEIDQNYTPMNVCTKCQHSLNDFYIRCPLEDCVCAGLLGTYKEIEDDLYFDIIYSKGLVK
jgi:MoaA/NifB/PqqE/SkfB family radical SAM enzyme